MAALDLVSLQEFKTWAGVQGTGADQRYSTQITAASRIIESALGRRLVYRAPPEDPESDNIVAPATYTNGPLTIAAQPGSGGRTLIVTLTTATAGTVTVTGTVGGVTGQKETFDAGAGPVQHGVKFFTAISAIDVAGATGGGQVKVGSSVGYLEHHTPSVQWGGGIELAPLDWPVQAIAEANEDAAGVFGSATALVLGTDYRLTRPGSGDVLVRLSGKHPIPWTFGHRAVRLTYSAGYTQSAVPQDLKEKCRKLVLLLFEEVEKGRGMEIATWSNALGSGSRFGPAGLTRKMREELQVHARHRFGADTGERDFDLEAA